MDPATADRLLVYARDVVQAEIVPGNPVESPRDLPEIPHGGAFVTLKRCGRLRGCMGTFTPRGTLAETVEAAARSAAHDPRFVTCPITPAEMDEIRLEVSLLGVLQPTDRPESLQVGRHGIWIRRGSVSGCFLPQVATEHHWTAEEFLSNCCSMKAGLPPDAWRAPQTEVLLFTAEILRERG